MRLGGRGGPRRWLGDGPSGSRNVGGCGSASASGQGSRARRCAGSSSRRCGSCGRSPSSEVCGACPARLEGVCAWLRGAVGCTRGQRRVSGPRRLESGSGHGGGSGHSGRTGGGSRDLGGRRSSGRGRHRRRRGRVRRRGLPAGGNGARVQRCRARNLTHRGGAGGATLQPRGGLGADALLLFGRALGCAPGPLAQPLKLARLREHEQRQNRDPYERGKRGDRPDLRERARKRQRQ